MHQFAREHVARKEVEDRGQEAGHLDQDVGIGKVKQMAKTPEKSSHK